MNQIDQKTISLLERINECNNSLVQIYNELANSGYNDVMSNSLLKTISNNILMSENILLKITDIPDENLLPVLLNEEVIFDFFKEYLQVKLDILDSVLMMYSYNEIGVDDVKLKAIRSIIGPYRNQYFEMLKILPKIYNVLEINFHLRYKYYSNLYGLYKNRRDAEFDIIREKTGEVMLRTEKYSRELKKLEPKKLRLSNSKDKLFKDYRAAYKKIGVGSIG